MIDVEVRGITSLSNETSLVRFSTIRTDPGGQPQSAQPWQAVVSWRFSGAAMSEADRLTNPLGFQVTRYRRNAEIPIESAPSDRTSPAPAGTAAIAPAQATMIAPVTVPKPLPGAKP
jgi:type IV secretion system protein VirB8